MYKDYFGLKELPFSIAPDPRYLYMSTRHREALAHLVYGIKSEGGFVLLTGEVGTGKTTICRSLLEQIPKDTDIAFILNPKLTVLELLATLCDELGITYPAGTASVKVFVDRINAYLLDAHAKGRKTVLIIEEAQNLGAEVLEQVRLLTNLETTERKLLQIIMLGQPELREMLSRPELRQLAQRITARYHLEPLSKKEAAAYVNHRLAVAGARTTLFPPSTIRLLHRLTGGIPRLVNLLCDRALLGSYVEGKEQVGRKTLAQAAREVFGKNESRQPWKIIRWVLPVLLVLAFTSTLAVLYLSHQDPAVSTGGALTVSQSLAPAAPGDDAPAQGSERPEGSYSQMPRSSRVQSWKVLLTAETGDRCEQAWLPGPWCPGEVEDLNALLGTARFRVAPPSAIVQPDSRTEIAQRAQEVK